MTVPSLFPSCDCQFHRESSSIPDLALQDPFAFLPPKIEFTDEMQEIAELYRAGEFNWSNYLPFQAATFLQPTSRTEHHDRRTKFSELQQSVFDLGYSLPQSLTTLFSNDEYVDRIHHNLIWLSLPEKVVRLPSHPEFISFLFLTECDGNPNWHLILGPNDSHAIVTAYDRFG